MKLIENIPYGTDSEKQRLDIYLPDMEANAVFLYFHGGALEKGRKKSAAVFAPYLTERGIAIGIRLKKLLTKFAFYDIIMLVWVSFWIAFDFAEARR